MVAYLVLYFSVYAFPAQDSAAGSAIARPALAADRRAFDGPTVADPASAAKRAFADPALAADSKVQNWAGLAPAADQVLSSAEKAMGNAMIKKLDFILKDPTDDTIGKKRCLNHMDLQLLLDSSGSIGRSEFLYGKSVLKVCVWSNCV